MIVAGALSALGASPALADGLTINPQSEIKHAVVSKFYNQDFSATTDATGTEMPGYTFEGSGTLPDGLHFGTGANRASIIGTPTTPLQSTQFTVSAHDADGNTGSRTYTVTVDAFDTTPQQGPPADQQIVALVNSVAFIALCPVRNPAIITSTLNTLLGGGPPSQQC
jgi:hypothetical protein